MHALFIVPPTEWSLPYCCESEGLDLAKIGGAIHRRSDMPSMRALAMQLGGIEDKCAT